MSIDPEINLHHFDDLTNATLCLKQCIENASRTLRIFSQSLDYPLYSRPQLVDSISVLARRSKQTNIQILIQDPRLLYGKHHPILALAQRLPTTFTIRVCLEPIPFAPSHFLLADSSCVVRFTNEQEYKGYLNLNGRVDAQSLLDWFQPTWSYHCHPDSQFTRLSL
jgi:hypothetical protein